MLPTLLITTVTLLSATTRLKEKERDDLEDMMRSFLVMGEEPDYARAIVPTQKQPEEDIWASAVFMDPEEQNVQEDDMLASAVMVEREAVVQKPRDPLADQIRQAVLDWTQDGQAFAELQSHLGRYRKVMAAVDRGSYPEWQKSAVRQRWALVLGSDTMGILASILRSVEMGLEMADGGEVKQILEEIKAAEQVAAAGTAKKPELAGQLTLAGLDIVNELMKMGQMNPVAVLSTVLGDLAENDLALVKAQVEEIMLTTGALAKVATHEGATEAQRKQLVMLAAISTARQTIQACADGLRVAGQTLLAFHERQNPHEVAQFSESEANWELVKKVIPSALSISIFTAWLVLFALFHIMF